jgi:hypothetical protein
LSHSPPSASTISTPRATSACHAGERDAQAEAQSPAQEARARSTTST